MLDDRRLGSTSTFFRDEPKKIVDGKAVPYLSPGERQSVIQIVAGNIAYEETLLAPETSWRTRLADALVQAGIISGSANGYQGPPPEDPTVALTISVKSYMKDVVFGQLAYGDLKGYVSEHERDLGGWMPYVEDTVGGGWNRLTNGVVVVWNGEKYVAAKIASGVQSGYETGLDWTAGGVNAIAGDDAGKQVRNAGLWVEWNVKQPVQFVAGVTVGGTETAGGMVEGTGGLIGNAYYYFSYGDYRDTVNTTVAKGLTYAWDNPTDVKDRAKVALQNGVDQFYNSWLEAYNKGDGSYFAGNVTGEAGVFIGTFFLGPELLAGKTGAVVDATSAIQRTERVFEPLAGWTRAAEGSVSEREAFTTFFHGTTAENASIIRSKGIDLSVGNPQADFGQGFYMSRSEADALWSAERKGARPTLEAVQFDVPNSQLASLSPLTFDTAGPEWQSFVKFHKGLELMERTGEPYIPPAQWLHGGEPYDMVTGPLFRHLGGDGVPIAWPDVSAQTSIHTHSTADLFTKFMVVK